MSDSRPWKEKLGVLESSMKDGIRTLSETAVPGARERECLWFELFRCCLVFWLPKLCARVCTTCLKRCGAGGLSPGPERRELLSGSCLMQMGSEE